MPHPLHGVTAHVFPKLVQTQRGDLPRRSEIIEYPLLRWRMRRIVYLVFIFGFMLMMGGVGLRVLHVEARPQHRDEPPPPDPALEKMKKNAEKQRNQQRQSELRKDTDQLFELASELKKSVDNSNEHVLSVEVIRKTEQIERLARSVRDKMKAEGYSRTIPDVRQ